MNSTPTLSGEKSFVRWLDKSFSALETLINRATTERFNPLYHLGTLAIFLLLALTATGVYLTFLYRPGPDTAYASVEWISSHWFGSLMRSIHRYASDAFLVVSILHALKSLASGRFWGSRTLAWVTGWVLVVLTWFTGVLGFWLVWDRRAQWITEAFIALMKGPVAVTFLTTNIVTSTFSTFIIAEFLHVFIPLAFAILIFVHVLRLARARLLPPRWMIAFSTAGLILVALLLPFRSAPIADLDSVIPALTIDIWYLGFLIPFEKWGSTAALLGGGLILALLILLPWLARGRHSGPAYVTGSRCTGCSICSVECPYKAIEMLTRDEPGPDGSKRFARVYPDLCTGCGICVGTCATMGIELKQLPTEQVYKAGLLARVQRAAAGGHSPAVVISCQRQVSAGSLSRYLTKDGADRSNEVISCVLPCTGMADALWTAELFAAGARDIAFVSCPYDDCANREGPHWLYTRFRRHKGLLTPALHWIETAPGHAHSLVRLLDHLKSSGEEKQTVESLPEVKRRELAWPRIPAALAAFALLMILSLPVDLPASPRIAGRGDVRFVIEHHGVAMTSQAFSGVKLPENAIIDSTKIKGSQRYPVLMRVTVDGRPVLASTYEPTGLRKEGMINGFDQITLPAGLHVLEVSLNDSGGEWRSLFSQTLEISPEKFYTLVYQTETDRFELR